MEQEIDAVVAETKHLEGDAEGFTPTFVEELSSLLCQPFDTYVMHTKLPEERIIEKRWNCDSLTFVSADCVVPSRHFLLMLPSWKRLLSTQTLPSEPEIGLREVLQEYADRTIEGWRAVLPGRCQFVPSAPASTKLDVFEPDTAALADRIARITGTE